MYRTTLTRRRALELGAAAMAGASAATGLRPAAAVARRTSTAFRLDLTDALGGARAAAAGGWRLLEVRRAPARFDVLGLAWAGGRDVRAQVRARRRGGAWTPWTALHAAGDHGPDGARAPTGTDPCWTGTADEFQVRLTGAPRRLEARFVRAAPAAAAARRLHRRGSARGLRGAGRAGRAAQVPEMVPRSAWGGDRYPPKATPEYGSVQVGFVHHTVNANDYAPEESAAIVLGICRYHRDHNGWNDIGYNFLVDRYGKVFEGRAGGIDQAVIGAQAQGYNAVSTGVAVIGDHQATAVAPEAAEAVARVLAWKLGLHGAPVTGEVTVTSAGGSANRHPAGTPVTLQRISGHRDGNATACPGAALYGHLPAIRQRAAQLAAASSKLTMAASRTTLRAPARVALSGTLRFGDGSSPADRPVHIAYQTATGGAWELLATARTDAAGAWSAAVGVPMTGRLVAGFPGDGALPPLASAVVDVTVTPVLSVAVSRATVRRRGRVRVTGTVEPFAPEKVDLLLERHTGRGTVVVRRKRARVIDGAFATEVRLWRRGRHRLTVTAAGAVRRRSLRAR